MQNLVTVLRWIRWPNLLLIAGCQVLIHYFIVLPFCTSNEWAIHFSWGFFALVASTLFLSCGGYLINDYYDADIDRINRSGKTVVGSFISKRALVRIYAILSVIGGLLGLYAAKEAGATMLALMQVGLWAALLWYSAQLKRKPFVGNLMVALLTASSVVLVYIYDRMACPASEPGSIRSMTIYVMAYAGFAFFMNLLREIVKDVEDMEGDRAFGCRTLPILMGVKKVKTVVVGIAAVTVAGLAVAIYFLIDSHQVLASAYAVIVMLPGWILFFFRLVRAEKKMHFSDLSRVLKLMILGGILSIPLLFIF
jgi:4-hydroxybenzoate polyprenyltransferase